MVASNGVDNRATIIGYQKFPAELNFRTLADPKKINDLPSYSLKNSKKGLLVKQ
jgi:hypothetical protein